MNTLITLLSVLVIVAISSIFYRNDKTKLAPLIIVAAIIGSLVASMGFRIRELVEAPFAYLDSSLAVLTGMIFVTILMDNGTFEIIFKNIITKQRGPMNKTLLLVLFIALPGIFTGTAIASIFTTGTIVGTYLMKKSIRKEKVVEFVAISSLFGMILPPICLPAMIIVVSRSGSYPAAFEGYAIPLLIIALPALLIYAKISSKWIKDLGVKEVEKYDKSTKYSIPLIVVGILLFSHNFLYSFMPFLGYPFIFTIGIILSSIISREKTNIFVSAGNAINFIAPTVAVIFAIASALEILVLTGVTGKLATMFYTANPIIFTLISMGIVILSGVLLGGPFSVLIGVICSYLLGSIAYGNTEMMLMGLSSALCISLFLPKEGGLISDAAIAIGVKDIDSQGIVLEGILPIVIILAIGIIYTLGFRNLNFLIL